MAGFFSTAVCRVLVLATKSMNSDHVSNGITIAHAMAFGKTSCKNPANRSSRRRSRNHRTVTIIINILVPVSWHGDETFATFMESSRSNPVSNITMTNIQKCKRP